MLRYKFCCGSNHAVMVVPLWPETIASVKWYQALYKCEKCKTYSIRGEADKRTLRQKDDWSTFVKVINEQQAQELIAERKRRDQVEAVMLEYQALPPSDQKPKGVNIS